MKTFKVFSIALILGLNLLFCKDKFNSSFLVTDLFPYLQIGVDSMYIPNVSRTTKKEDLNKFHFYQIKKQTNGNIKYESAGSIVKFIYGPNGFWDDRTIKIEHYDVEFLPNNQISKISIGLCMLKGWEVMDNNKTIINLFGDPNIEKTDAQDVPEIYTWQNQTTSVEIYPDYSGSGRFHITIEYL